MKKLIKMTKTQLQDEYFIQNGVFPQSDKDSLIAALYYGKRVENLTQEEIFNISEF